MASLLPLLCSQSPLILTSNLFLMLHPVRPVESSLPEVVESSVDALGAVLLDYYGVVGVRLEEKAGVRELQVPGREAPRPRKGRAARGWKLIAVHLADVDVEVVALGVLGDHDHAGQRVAVRGAGRVEELRMGVAAVLTLSSAPRPTLLTRMRVVVCACAGIDQRSTPPSASRAMSSSVSGAKRRGVVRTRGEEGRDLPDGENRLDVSRRVVRRRDASSGSGARRRGAFMTYPRFAGAKSRGGGG